MGYYLQHTLHYLGVLCVTKRLPTGLTQIPHITRFPSNLVHPRQNLKTLYLLAFIASVVLEDPLGLDGVGQAVRQLPEVQAQKGDL